ncbi:MAG: peroxiredoxin [Acidimicrobiales bacterium]|jgi:peroxiredoxin
MSIAVGERVPDIEIWTGGADGPETVRTGDVLGKGTVVLFAVPGAFTPTCSDYHLPGYLVRSDDLHAKGVDTIACVSVNDPYVMDAWRRNQGVGKTIVMLADGNGVFTREMGLETDKSGAGLGLRSQRYAAVIKDGVVTTLLVEPGGGLTVSSADSVLSGL